MTTTQQDGVKARVAELRLRAKEAEPFHAEALEIWRTNSESICAEPSSWTWPDADAEGVQWAFECASLERLFSPEGMAWEMAQRHIEAAMADPRIAANPDVVEMLSDALLCIDWNVYGRPPGENVWHWLVSHESVQKARSHQASQAAKAKNAKPRQWVINQWRDRTDVSQSKSSFARQYASLVKTNYRLEVTPETIARDWLPKG